jgi:RNA polymerase sigma-70 factor (ECF subfamily)
MAWTCRSSLTGWSVRWLVAVAEVEVAAAARRIVEAVAAQSGVLDAYPLQHAIRADLLERLGRRDDAGAALDAALAGSASAAERRDLARRRDGLSS